VAGCEPKEEKENSDNSYLGWKNKQNQPSFVIWDKSKRMSELQNKKK
jgi:hypothetical protein